MRKLLIGVLVIGALAIPETAQAKAATSSKTPRVLTVIHKWRDATWAYQQIAHVCCRPYGWLADRPTTSRAQRWHIAVLWHRYSEAAHKRAQAVLAAQQASYGGVPSWFVSDMRCISDHEEYGFDGPNTVAGYFGLIYPPSGYISPGPSIASTYGDSWLDVPLSAQLALSYALEQHYGWSPWSTASSCGL